MEIYVLTYEAVIESERYPSEIECYKDFKEAFKKYQDKIAWEKAEGVPSSSFAEGTVSSDGNGDYTLEEVNNTQNCRYYWTWYESGYYNDCYIEIALQKKEVR